MVGISHARRSSFGSSDCELSELERLLQLSSIFSLGFITAWKLFPLIVVGGKQQGDACGAAPAYTVP